MEELVSRWRDVQEESIGYLDNETKHGQLLPVFIPQFEKILEAMYDINRPDTSITEHFEREFNLKQKLAQLLGQGTKVEAQVDMNIALWKEQPYADHIVRKTAS